MYARSLRIAWLGPAPGDDGGVPGVGTELLSGLARRGHRIDCFFPAAGLPVPERIAAEDRIDIVWGSSRWQWDRWYSRTRITALASGMVARSVASLRLRRQIARRHRAEPYDLIYQFSSIEGPAVPARLTRHVPLVIHPETHAAGELRALVAERRLGLRCHSRGRYAAVLAIMLLRALTQRVRIRRARLLVCISSVFRDHLVRDYGFPVERTVVTPNPVRLERFPSVERGLGEPPTILVLGRIAVRKGIETVVAVAKLLVQRGVQARLRVVGGPSLWSDYTPLLAELPAENSEYVGALPAASIPAELARADVLLQLSRYEPFALTIAEALAAGVPVVGTSEVGAIEGVDRAVAVEVAPGDAEATVRAIERLLGRLGEDPAGVRERARSQARALFAPDVVCDQISKALEALVAGPESEGTAEPASGVSAAS